MIRRKGRFLTVVIIFFIAIYLSNSFIEQTITRKRLESTKDKLTHKYFAELEHTEYLKTQIERAQSQEYIERLARERLNLVKPGDIVFIDIGPKE